MVALQARWAARAVCGGGQGFDLALASGCRSTAAGHPGVRAGQPGSSRQAPRAGVAQFPPGCEGLRPQRGLRSVGAREALPRRPSACSALPGGPPRYH